MVSREHTDEAERLIFDFLEKTKAQYSDTVFSANTHSLMHLAWQVKQFGPLWCASSMMFESANYLLQSKFTGSVNHLPLVIERYHRSKQSLRESVRHHKLLDYCNSLRKTSKFFRKRAISNGVPDDLCNAGDLFYSNYQSSAFHLDSLAHSSSFNSFISFKHNNKLRFGQIRLFFNKNGAEMIGVYQFKVVQTTKCPTPVSCELYSFVKVEKTRKVYTLFVDAIHEKLLHIYVNDMHFLVPLLSRLEHD